MSETDGSSGKFWFIVTFFKQDRKGKAEIQKIILI